MKATIKEVKESYEDKYRLVSMDRSEVGTKYRTQKVLLLPGSLLPEAVVELHNQPNSTL